MINPHGSRAASKEIPMQNERTTRGRGSAAVGGDVTRDSMLRDDETARVGGTSAQGRTRNTNADNDYWTSEGPGPKVMAADTLQGDSVYNEADEKLGEVTDIMIDVPTGRVAYAVMSVGGVFGIGDKLFAIPWQALTLDTENKCFRMNISSEQLKNAPGFDKDHWPTMADQTWAQQVHDYYGAEPYWY
jgi:sporulation protein YlmC with PRC-barrel domain